MGNTPSTSGKHAHSHNIRDETVDFGHLSPQGIYTGPQDWNQEIVGKLIVDRKLAPFYRPLEDYEANWNDETILRNRKLKEGEQSLPAPMTMTLSVPSSNIKGSGKGKAAADRREPQRMSEAEVYHGAIECPICFMYYPPNINRSRCCDQAICTECFVQIKRNEPTTTHLVSEPAACPYCVQENFGVTYEPPSWRAGLVLGPSSSGRPELPRLGGSALSSGSADSHGPLTADRPRRKSVPHQAGEVVTIDYIRPDWEAKLEAVRAAVARRANRRIVMRQVGDRLIPVGITSGRVVPMGVTEGEGGGRRSRRPRNGGSSDVPMGMTGHDLEELMMMEAMRLSLLEHEAQQRREREAQAATATASNSALPPRESSTPSPDPASEVQIQEQGANASSSLSVNNSGVPSRSGSTTPLQLAPATENSLSDVPHRQSLDTLNTPPVSHRRTGSGPIQVAASPLNGAAALAMAVGFPSTTGDSTPGNARAGHSGFTPRTLNTLSAAVGVSSIPAAILGSSPIDHPNGEPMPSAGQSGQDDQVHTTAARPPSTEPQNGYESAPDVSDGPSLATRLAETAATTLGTESVAHASSPLGPGLADSTTEPENPPGLSTANQGSQASSGRGPSTENTSAGFLTADARTTTEASMRTVDSQVSKNENYAVLPSSPETETEQPLMEGPPQLARLDTDDSYHTRVDSGGPGAT